VVWILSEGEANKTDVEPRMQEKKGRGSLSKGSSDPDKNIKGGGDSKKGGDHA